MNLTQLQAAVRWWQSKAGHGHGRFNLDHLEMVLKAKQNG